MTVRRPPSASKFACQEWVGQLNEKIDRQEKILARILEWIRAADARFPPLAAMNTAMLGIIVALAIDVNKWTLMLVVVASVAAILLALSLICLALAMFPRIGGPPRSVIYFEIIKAMDSASYHTAINDLTETDYLSDLIEQSHRNAEIAHVKFRYVRFAMVAWFTAIIPWVSTLGLFLASQD